MVTLVARSCRNWMPRSSSLDAAEAAGRPVEGGVPALALIAAWTGAFALLAAFVLVLRGRAGYRRA